MKNKITKPKHTSKNHWERKNYKWIYLFLLPTIVIFLMFYLVPIVQVFVTSFSQWDGFNDPVFNGLKNYFNLFTSNAFLISLKNLLLWALIAMVLHVGFGTVVVFVLYQRRRGWQLIRYIQLPLCRSAIATGVICSITSRITMYEQISLTTAGGPGNDTMSLPILLVNAVTDYRYGYANAIGVVMFVIGLVMMGVINKVFRMNEVDY